MKDIKIIDIEASGLHFDSYPIEIAVLINGQIKSWLIKPEPNWQHWSKTAEGMHGITREMLFKKGIHARKAANELVTLLKNTDGVLYSDAAYWDEDWMDTLFHAAKQKQPFIIASIYDLLENDQAARFDIVKNELVQSGKYRQHRAEDDVKLLHYTYLKVSSSETF